MSSLYLAGQIRKLAGPDCQAEHDHPASAIEGLASYHVVNHAGGLGIAIAGEIFAGPFAISDSAEVHRLVRQMNQDLDLIRSWFAATTPWNRQTLRAAISNTISNPKDIR